MLRHPRDRQLEPRYTLDEIWYQDGGMLTLGGDELRHLVSTALSRIPKQVADKVLTKRLFIMPQYAWEKGYLVPLKLTKNKRVIALPEGLLEEGEESVVQTILHEVAHFWLQHEPSLLAESASEDLDKKQEDEADNCAKRWLEGYRNR
jgi:hypothetical protein